MLRLTGPKTGTGSFLSIVIGTWCAVLVRKSEGWLVAFEILVRKREKKVRVLVNVGPVLGHVKDGV